MKAGYFFLNLQYTSFHLNMYVFSFLPSMNCNLFFFPLGWGNLNNIIMASDFISHIKEYISQSLPKLLSVRALHLSPYMILCD